jgi:SAM-dependent methyltransferase
MFAGRQSLEQLLPVDLQVKATMHFTPPEVARRVAKLLAPHPGAVVLDIGAGAGMFCIAAALAARSSQFVGVEQRRRLVDVANGLVERLQITNVRFILADALDLDWSVYDALYFYNPFAEYVMETPFLIDRSIAFDPKAFMPCIERVQDKLALQPHGTRVATYHGFGGELPEGYVLAAQEPYGTDRVELWVKAR